MIKLKKTIGKEKKIRKVYGWVCIQMRGRNENLVLIEFDYLRVDKMRKG
jgi:hypothetical protein